MRLDDVRAKIGRTHMVLLAIPSHGLWGLPQWMMGELAVSQYVFDELVDAYRHGAWDAVEGKPRNRFEA